MRLLLAVAIASASINFSGCSSLYKSAETTERSSVYNSNSFGDLTSGAMSIKFGKVQIDIRRKSIDETIGFEINDISPTIKNGETSVLISSPSVGLSFLIREWQFTEGSPVMGSQAVFVVLKLKSGDHIATCNVTTSTFPVSGGITIGCDR